MSAVMLDYVTRQMQPNKEIIRSINRRYRKKDNVCFCGEKIKKIPEEKFADYLSLFG